MTVTAPRYRIKFFAPLTDGTYGIGPLIAEVDPLNLGYSEMSGNVPEMFFTMSKHDQWVPLLVAYEGRAHVRVERWSELPGYDEIVFAGWLMEHDAIGSHTQDIVFGCYGYVAGLYWLLTDWNQEWTNATLDTIVGDLWTRAKTTLSNSMLNFVQTGAIINPVTETNGDVGIILPLYTAYYKRILFVMQEMAALGQSDTLNTPIFEITHSATPTFNFWGNVGVDRPNARWEWGDGIVESYQHFAVPVFRRNDLEVVGSAPFNILLRESFEHEQDINVFGRRQEPLYLAWVRDQDEMHRAGLLRSRIARLSVTDLSLSFYVNSTPPPTPSSPWRLLDRAKVKIDDGIVQVDDYFLIAGHQTLFTHGAEKVNVLMRKMYETDIDLFSLDADRLLDNDLVMDAV